MADLITERGEMLLVFVFMRSYGGASIQFTTDEPKGDIQRKFTEGRKDLIYCRGIDEDGHDVHSWFEPQKSDYECYCLVIRKQPKPRGQMVSPAQLRPVPVR